MRKKTKALSGASQDAYFRRVLKANPNLSAEERDRLVARLRAEVAQLRVRLEPRREGDAEPAVAAAAPEPAEAAAPLSPTDTVTKEGVEVVAGPAPATEAPPVAAASLPFDPFSPNVIVVLRKAGRDAVLAALGAIGSADDLRLLAREQRLSVAAELESAAELRAAIVTAAERRVANRMAAAS